MGDNTWPFLKIKWNLCSLKKKLRKLISRVLSMRFVTQWKKKKSKIKLFSCGHATLEAAMSVGWSVGRSVRRSVTLSFFGVYGRFLHYSSYPNTWFAFFITAPAHPHATCCSYVTDQGK